MKQLTKEQIDQKLKQIIPEPANYFDYHHGTSEIKLDGTFCTDELYAIADFINGLMATNKEINKIKNLKIKGFTAKDIKVTYAKHYGTSWRYSFYIMKDGKDYDFYYGKSDGGAGDWWPEPEEEGYLSPITQFIPDGFGEAMENCYDYHGSHKEALELLKDCGFTVERGEDY